MDSAGFLIMHEDFLLSSTAASDAEYAHLTQKEKYIAPTDFAQGPSPYDNEMRVPSDVKPRKESAATASAIPPTKSLSSGVNYRGEGRM